MPYNDFEISTVFRRKVQLERAPENATLSIRAFKHFEVTINGRQAAAEAVSNSNWKDARDIGIADLLLAGTNEISITVFNRKAPPALWASVKIDSKLIPSSPDWESSLLGAAWRPAWLATSPRQIIKGNLLYGGENTFDSLRKSLPVLLVFTIFSCVILYGSSIFLRRLKGQGESGSRVQSQFMIRIVTVLGLLWVALFLNNIPLLPRGVGFDQAGHEEYINFIRTNNKLPLPGQGWETAQAPLYYIVGSGIVACSGSATASDRASMMLRLLGLVTGIAHFTLIFLSLRLLFPGCLGAQWFGVMLAACLPEHLYISHYLNNEFLASALTTGALYCCLRLLKEEQESWKLPLAIGLCFGAALLTKVSPILATPFIGGILAHRILTKPKGEIIARTRTLVIVFGTAFAVAGWYYVRVWIHSGKPFVGNFDSWGQDNGFQTTSYLCRFGESLVRPYFSVFHGFGDGIYSSMWGDALLGGMTQEYQPAWNYTLMTEGFVLALLPMMVILTGCVTCVMRFLRRPEPIWFLLLGLAVTTYAALFYVSIQVPYYCDVKAFYALMTLLPVCAFGATGWEVWSNRAGKLRAVLYVAALLWAMNSYASFWIQGGASATHTMRGIVFERQDRPADAFLEWTEALRIDPHDFLARRSLAVHWARVGNLEQSRQETKLLLADDPDNAAGLMQSALLLAANEQIGQALQQARRAAEVAPDYDFAYQKIGEWSLGMGKGKEAVDAAREGLRIKPFSPQLHELLAFSLESLGEHSEAARQMQIASELQPK